MKMSLLSSGWLAFGFMLASGMSCGRAESPEDAPWKRFLTGDDAKRVEELELKARAHYDAGHYAEAAKSARPALETRSRLQGPNHWQTISAKTNFESHIAIAALPREA